MSTAASMLRCGVPRVYQDAAAFQADIDAYFAGKDADKAPYTMHGLARALDLSRQGLLNYESYTDEPLIVDAVKRARERVAEWTETRLHTAGFHPAGPIFSLKNNFGWKDEQSTTVNVAIAVGITAGDDSRRGLLPDLVINQIRPENAIVPALGTGEITHPHSAESAPTFAPSPSLSPDSVNTYPVQKPRKRRK